MNRIEAMRVFCVVIEAGGFAPAAERLGLSTSATSRHVAQLEAHLNVRLLNRTTRRVRPSEAGLAYYERCLQILADIEEADAAVSGEAQVARGRLRLTAPTSLALNRLGPAFAEFGRRHPRVLLDLVLSDYTAGLLDEGIDLAIRVGPIGSDTVVARRLGMARLLVAGSPAYLNRRGRPQHPSELATHECLTYAYSSSGQQWAFRSVNGGDIDVRIAGPVHGNHGLMLAEMAAQGAGLTSAPDFLLQPWLADGRLEEVLPAWNQTSLPIHAVYPSRRHLSVKVQLMISFLQTWFAAHTGVGQ